MNYLAGFLLITFADCVAAERGVSSLLVGGGTGGSSLDPATRTAAGEVGGGAGASLEPELPPAIAREGVAGGEGHGGAEAQLAAADLELIEREAVEVMLGIIALQGGVLSRDLWGLHAVREDVGGGGGEGGGYMFFFLCVVYPLENWVLLRNYGPDESRALHTWVSCTREITCCTAGYETQHTIRGRRPLRTRKEEYD